MPTTPASKLGPIGLAVGLLATAGCEQVEQVQDRFRDLTPYEAYQTSLADAGLFGTALGTDWIAAGRRAVEGAAPVSLPFREQGFITPEEPAAMAYRVTIPRGRRLTAEVTLVSDNGTRVFVDLFRVPDDDADPHRPVLSTDSVPGTFVHEPWRGGDFILRVQPELLRGGQYQVSMNLEAQLAFPVDGHGVQSIYSGWGANRDAGRRTHEGVDIFARRGTPALAAAAGTVSRVQVTSRGGKVVWVRDPVRNANLYYAHLDSQTVVRGQRLEVGDTVGFVGNTGNARTTPPHLHFGVYRRGEGAVNPFPFIDPPRTALAELTADLDQLGSWVRLVSDGIRLREGPGTRAEVIRELEQYTPVRVLGGSAEFFRVRLPDGLNGYVAARLTESASEPYAAEVAAAGNPVLSRPDQSSPVMAMFPREAEVPVLGRYAGFLLVRVPGGGTGWIGQAAQQQD